VTTPETNSCAVTYTYDANGNLQSDGVNTYAWDADGNMRSVNTTTVTYDALDRVVEVSAAPYTQVVYDPLGNKLALMNGQTLTRAFVGLPSGATAVYNASGLQYYRHSDWLNSSRLASTPSRTTYYDGGYAAYGENYAETGTQDRSFTGQNQDIVSTGAYQLYDFLMREYHPTWGRWVSPDPAGLAAANPANPQSWNRYAYVMNMTTTLSDPLGLCAHPGQSGGDDCDGVPRIQHTGISEFLEAFATIDGYTMGDLVGPVFDDEDHIIGFLWTVDPIISWSSFGWGDSSGASQPGGIANLPMTKRDIKSLLKLIPCPPSGGAPPPQFWESQGQANGTNPVKLLGFQSGGPLDAQAFPGGYHNADYANYVYGVYNNAAGFPLSVALAGADARAAFNRLRNPSQYSNRVMDPTYNSLPRQNVNDIRAGFNDEKNGTLCSTIQP
jgi:RHS repeat-associated protein